MPGVIPDAAFALAVPAVSAGILLGLLLHEAAQLTRRTVRRLGRGSTMNYAKAVAAIIATGLSALVAALTGDGAISAQEWVNVALLAVGAASVFAAPNVPGAAYTKSVLAVLTAVLTLTVNLIAGGLDPTEWMQLAIAALGALGVYAVPNRSQPVGIDV